MSFGAEKNDMQPSIWYLLQGQARTGPRAMVTRPVSNLGWSTCGTNSWARKFHPTWTDMESFMPPYDPARHRKQPTTASTRPASLSTTANNLMPFKSFGLTDPFVPILLENRIHGTRIWPISNARQNPNDVSFADPTDLSRELGTCTHRVPPRHITRWCLNSADSPRY